MLSSEVLVCLDTDSSFTEFRPCQELQPKMSDLTSEENPRVQEEVKGFTTLSCERFLEFHSPGGYGVYSTRRDRAFFLYEDPGSAAHVLIPEKHPCTKPNQKVDGGELHSLLHVLITLLQGCEP